MLEINGQEKIIDINTSSQYSEINKIIQYVSKYCKINQKDNQFKFILLMTKLYLFYDNNN